MCISQRHNHLYRHKYMKLCCHTCSNFVSSSRKLKFRPIILKHPSKPTCSWYVLQDRSITFKSFFLCTYIVSKLPGSSCMCPSPALCSPRGSSCSTIAEASLSLLSPTCWVPGRAPLTPGDAPRGVSWAPCWCGHLLLCRAWPGLPPAHLNSGLRAPSTSSSMFGLNDHKAEKLRSAAK